MELFENESAYIEALEARSSLPDGFRSGTVPLTFTPSEKSVDKPYDMNLGAVVLDSPTPLFAGRLTRNLFPGAPVKVVRRRLAEPAIQGLLINNRIANVCTATGVEDAEKLLEEFGRNTGIPASLLMPASTGIIGWRLPVDVMNRSMGALADSLQSDSILGVARGMMTTDLFPKVRSTDVGGGRIVGIAKGAGMIEPNMGTMFAFIFTDLAIEREKLREIHAEVVETSLNRITIDGDQSTSDMAILISSGTRQVTDIGEFRDGLYSVCRSLAEDIVRNGEGTCHVIRILVRRAPDNEVAVGLGKAVANSPLVKTAVYGDDPNVGRIIMAVGDYLGNTHPAVDPTGLTVSIGGLPVFENAAFCIGTEVEDTVGRHMKAARLDPETRKYPAHDRVVDIELDLDRGTAEAEILGSDLSYGYVRENADYRT